MAGDSPLYYWDTCLFLAWLKDEQRKPGEMDGVREIVERHKRREVRLMTSVLTMTEVLSAKIPIGMETLFGGLMKRISKQGIDTRIAALAHDLRNHYVVNTDQFRGKTLSTPDALHLATAILYRADEFHTFDDSNNRNSIGLIKLSGNVGGNDLKICKPNAKNPQLDLRKPGTN
ncbi:MAG: type II toxin-antitoxin system VapC family toxin [Pseudomonadota bacterium]|jgi:predicted nucleic acid-binding protein